MTGGCITPASPHVLAILSRVVDSRWDRDKSGGDFCCLGGLFCAVEFFPPLAFMYGSDNKDNLPFFICPSVLGFIYIRICFSIFQETVNTLLIIAIDFKLTQSFSDFVFIFWGKKNEANNSSVFVIYLQFKYLVFRTHHQFKECAAS